MARISVPDSIEAAPEAARPLLEGVKAGLGIVPNLYKLLSVSPAGLEGVLGLNGALAKGKLSPQTRHRIALAVANVNGCNYCNSAHTFIAKSLKLDDAEIQANRTGHSADAKADAAVQFARKVSIQRGSVSEADLQALKAAGFSDGEAIEIVLHVALNVATNYINEVFKTDIDFPATPAAQRAA